MKRYTPFLFALLVAIIAISSCSETVWDDLPKPIYSFVSKYYPGVMVDSYSDKNEVYYVKIKNGASFVFNMNYDWEKIDGNGVPLPQMLLFDQFPTPLYDYIESLGMTGEVYKVSRDRTTYTVGLQNTEISYDIQTETVVFPTAKVQDSMMVKA